MILGADLADVTEAGYGYSSLYSESLSRKAVVECVIEEVVQAGIPCERIADRYGFHRLEGSYSVRYKDSDAGEGEEKRRRGSREGARDYV